MCWSIGQHMYVKNSAHSVSEENFA